MTNNFLDFMKTEDFKNEFVLEENRVTYKNRKEIIRETLEREKFAKMYFEQIKKITKKLASILGVDIACISGSFSYNPNVEDDIDLLFIVDKHKLWICLFKAFIILRVWKIKGLNYNFCITYALSQDEFLKQLQEINDPLSLFDLVKAIPVVGNEKYNSFLSLSSNIYKYFNYSYKEKIIVNENKHKFKNITLNLIIYLLLFLYLNTKKLVSNLIIYKKEKYYQAFELETKITSYMVKSVKYEIYKRKFSKIFTH